MSTVEMDYREATVSVQSDRSDFFEESSAVASTHLQHWGATFTLPSSLLPSPRFIPIPSPPYPLPPSPPLPLQLGPVNPARGAGFLKEMLELHK